MLLVIEDVIYYHAEHIVIFSFKLVSICDKICDNYLHIYVIIIFELSCCNINVYYSINDCLNKLLTYLLTYLL